MTLMKDHYVPGDGLDKAGEWVWHFQLEARNLSKVSLLQKLVMEAFEKGYWRKYTFGTGRETWRACEFDYFLIASDIAYSDAAAVFTWKDRGRALAAATTSADPKKRRPLEQASAAWHSPTPETLRQRAVRLGWVSARGVRSAAPERARAYVRHGVSKDKHGRDARKQQVHPRREQLDQVIAQIVKRTKDETELRYIIDELQKRASKYGRPAGNHQQWARDAAAFKGDHKALMKHWGISSDMVYKRIRIIKSRLNYTKEARAR